MGAYRLHERANAVYIPGPTTTALYHRRNPYYMTGDLDANDVQTGYEFINLRTGLRGENWMLMLYGRNITDELTASGAADVPLARGSHFQYRTRGEVWGIQAAWEF